MLHSTFQKVPKFESPPLENVLVFEIPPHGRAFSRPDIKLIRIVVAIFLWLYAASLHSMASTQEGSNRESTGTTDNLHLHSTKAKAFTWGCWSPSNSIPNSADGSSYKRSTVYESIPTGMSPLSCSKSILSLLLLFSGYPEPEKTTVYDTMETIDLQTVALNGGFREATVVIGLHMLCK